MIIIVKSNWSKVLIDFSEEISIIEDNNIILCYIDNFSDKLKNHIKNFLTIVCYGPQINNPEVISTYPFENTIKSFKERYDRKTPEMKKGMLGELLAHILINNYIENLKVFSPYFNKEEANVIKFASKTCNCILRIKTLTFIYKIVNIDFYSSFQKTNLFLKLFQKY